MPVLVADDVFVSATGPVPQEVWDGLAGPHVYSSSRWLRFCGGDQRGVAGGLHGGPADRPVFAAPVTRVLEPGHAFYAWADILAARGLPAPPPFGIMVGGRRGYRTHLLPGSADRVTAAAEALDAVRSLAGSGSGSGSSSGSGSGSGDGSAAVAMFVDDTDVAAFRAAGVEAPPVLLNLDASLELPPGGWDGYLASLSRSRRHGVRRDARRFAESGLRVVRRPASECAADAGRLMAATEARYGHFADTAGLTRAFAEQAAAMGDAAEVVLALDEREVATGFCLYYRWDDTLYVRAVGFDYEASRHAGEYFELMYRQPILSAYQHGCRSVHFGIGSADAKARRGATLRGLWMLDLGHRSPLAGQEDAVTAANAALLADLADGSAIVTAALAPDVATLAPDLAVGAVGQAAGPVGGALDSAVGAVGLGR